VKGAAHASPNARFLEVDFGRGGIHALNSLFASVQVRSALPSFFYIFFGFHIVLPPRRDGCAALLQLVVMFDSINEA
jgi:hypothetical protein